MLGLLIVLYSLILYCIGWLVGFEVACFCVWIVVCLFTVLGFGCLVLLICLLWFLCVVVMLLGWWLCCLWLDVDACLVVWLFGCDLWLFIEFAGFAISLLFVVWCLLTLCLDNVCALAVVMFCWFGFGCCCWMWVLICLRVTGLDACCLLVGSSLGLLVLLFG